MTAREVMDGAPPSAIVEVRPKGIAIYGAGNVAPDGTLYAGTCPYTADDPYFIDRDRVDTPAHALGWLAHVLSKGWARGIEHDLMGALCEVLDGHLYKRTP